MYGKHLPAGSAKLRHMIMWRGKDTRADEFAVFTGKGRALSNAALSDYLVRNMDQGVILPAPFTAGRRSGANKGHNEASTRAWTSE